jgi:quercetin dioxygenase-like cupin family protein
VDLRTQRSTADNNGFPQGARDLREDLLNKRTWALGTCSAHLTARSARREAIPLSAIQLRNNFTPSDTVSARFLVLLLAILSCKRDARSSASVPDEGVSAFAAASAVVRADSNLASRSPHFAPMHELTGDVEILFGDPDKPGEPFVMRIRELPGSVVPLHSHPVDEHITIVQGTWFFAVGDTWDRAALKELKTGAYAFAPKGRMMFAASPDGAVVQVHGIGPFHIHWRDGVKTLDDSDAAGRSSSGEDNTSKPLAA